MEEIIESVKFLNSLLDKSDETLGAFARVEILRLNRLVRNYAAQQNVQADEGYCEHGFVMGKCWNELCSFAKHGERN